MPTKHTENHSIATASRHPGCIMILGAINDAQGNLSLMAKLRLTQGALEYKRHGEAGLKIFLTGGFGAHFNTTDKPHWHYARKYLENELSIPSEAILPEAVESANTVEDFEKARAIFEKYNFERVLIVTSTFHIERALYIAKHALPLSVANILAAPAPDDALDIAELSKARAHEARANEYLRDHYPPKLSAATNRPAPPTAAPLDKTKS